MEYIKYILQHLHEVLEYLYFQYKLCVAVAL